MAKRSPVNSQMPRSKTLPLTASSNALNDNSAYAPLSAYPHDLGTGGIPVKIMERHGERLPTTHAPAQTSPPRGRGMPKMGSRRFKG